MTDSICDVCHDRPTRDAAFVCDPCGDDWAKDLKELVESLWEDLEATIAGIKAVDWAKGAPRGGGDTGLKVNWRATQIARELHKALSEAVDHCLGVRVHHQSTNASEPPRTAPAMALWLTWRVDGLCADITGPRHATTIGRLVDQARAVVAWQPPERRFLGPCDICGKGEGFVYAEGDAEEAYCDQCAKAFPAEVRHTALVAELDEQLFTAAEIGDLSAYLGLRRGRERVTQQIHVWCQRKVIEAKGHNGKASTFRLGDVRHRLVTQDQAAG